MFHSFLFPDIPISKVTATLGVVNRCNKGNLIHHYRFAILHFSLSSLKTTPTYIVPLRFNFKFFFISLQALQDDPPPLYG